MNDKPENSSLVKRIITGVILVVIISLAIYIGGITFFALIMLLNILAINEYAKLITITGNSINTVFGQLAGSLLILTVWMAMQHYIPLKTVAVFIFTTPLLFGIELFRNKPGAFQTVAFTMLGILWISVSFSLFLAIGFYPFINTHYIPALILGNFTILWAGDVGAYAVGKWLGKRPLFYRISPKKTWEGSFGGLLIAILAGFINSLFFDIFSWQQWCLLAVIINITGTFGDLTKSMLKRNAGVKDSGTILPGHGGILDRFDSLIGSAPFSFIYLLCYA